MKLTEALKQLVEQDPYEEHYAWLYMLTPYSPPAAALYIIRIEDLKEAGIGIYDDSYEAIEKTVEWMLTNTGCTWCDLDALPPAAVDSPCWEISPGSRITARIKRGKR